VDRIDRLAQFRQPDPPKVILGFWEPSPQIRVGFYRRNADQGGARAAFHAESRNEAMLMAVILIVEDEVYIRQNAEWLIGDLGHSTLLAGDVGEALAHVSAAHPIDALFVDIRLGSVASGGYDVANEAVKLHPQMRVLYTSGTSLSAEMTGQFVGGGRFLQKPYSPAELESAVGALL
jgi:CheY-like chemotaxis protein